MERVHATFIQKLAQTATRWRFLALFRPLPLPAALGLEQRRNAKRRGQDYWWVRLDAQSKVDSFSPGTRDLTSTNARTGSTNTRTGINPRRGKTPFRALQFERLTEDARGGRH